MIVIKARGQPAAMVRGMWPYHPDLLATPVPRYTSFPTAAEFGDDVGPADMAAALAAVGAEEAISLYLHVPYCREVCWYCGCNTGAVNRSERLEGYLDRLGDEIDRTAAALNGRGRVVHIAWGGGSPNAMSPAQFDRLSRRLREAFATTGAAHSVEIDPRHFGWDWAEALARNGVNRVSLGVQTFSPRIQSAIGRIQPAEAIACTVGRLRASGVASINFDLMYGLPGQTAEDLAETLDTALSMRPERLAVFGYAHVPHLIPRQRRIDDSALPDAKARFEMAHAAHQHLTEAGHVPVGFDHFALPHDPLAVAAANGTLGRNFQGFTADPGRTLIGLGASAISAFPGALLQNEKNAGRWQSRLANGSFATARGIRRSARDRATALAIEALLCHGAADIADLPDAAAVRGRLAPFIDRGLATCARGTLRLDEGGLPYARGMAACLDPWRATSTVRFSSAV